MRKRLGIVVLTCLVIALSISSSNGEEKGTSADGYSATRQQMLIRTPDDLKDKRIGVLLGTTHDSYASKAYPKARIQQYKTPSDMILAVKTGKVDAAIYSREELVEMMRTQSELGLLEQSLFSTPIAMGFNHRNTELRRAFNRFLNQIKQNGIYDAMVSRWIIRGETGMPLIPKPSTGKTLTAGIISDNGLPFTVVKDNRLVGFNIELMERFGSYLGVTVTYQDIEFGSLIAATAGGKVDMIAAVMAITEERKKQIAFSDPYYELGAYIFALKKNLATDSSSETTVTAKGIPEFLRHIAAGFHGNILHEKRYLLILDGLKTTVIISILATLFGTLLGAVVCMMRMSKKTLLTAPARMYIAILRGTPVLVVLMLVFYVVFASVNIDPVLVAVIAFGINFGAYTAEIFRTGIEGIDKGQTEAGISLGFTRTGTFLHIILPQMVQRILPVYKGEFISLVKMTSIVGYIAVQDLTKAGDIIRSRTFDAFFPLVMVAVLYFIISWTLMQMLEYLERETNPRSRCKRSHQS